ncbi:MAG: SDR family NAD(P)-dependent oxidoreductase [Rickettsiales bacterium]
MKKTQNILITGASSGIGAGLAEKYSKDGATLYLQGRNTERLEEIANKCRNNGATVHTKIIDVTDTNGMERWIKQVDSNTPLDIVIANAGISAGLGQNGEDGKQVREIFATNIDGVINTVQPVIPLMKARKSGQIAIMSSLAGIRALPSSPAYSASKACVRYYGEALRGVLIKDNVYISVICPSYITTPMTDVNDFPMPLIMSVEKAANIIVSGLTKKKRRIAFPLLIHIPLWLISCLSPVITDPIFSRLPAKPSMKY